MTDSKSVDALIASLMCSRRHTRDEWRERQSAVPLTKVLQDWCDAEFPQMPDLLAPMLQLLSFDSYDESNPKSRAFMRNAFQLLGKCFTTALACYRRNVNVPTNEEFEMLLSLAVRALYFPQPKKATSFPEQIARFYVNRLIPCDAVPAELRRLAAEQFVLSWWAVDRKWYPRLYQKATATKELRWSHILQKAKRANKTVDTMLLIAERAAATRKKGACPVMSFHSTKGGPGKTTLACAAAMAFAMEGETVALLDLDMSNPSVIDLGVVPGKRQADIDVSLERLMLEGADPILCDRALAGAVSPPLPAKNQGKLLAMSVTGVLTMDERELRGDVNFAVLSPGRFEHVAANLQDIFSWLSETQKCDRIILDNSPGMQGFSLGTAALTSGLSGTIVMVATPDMNDLGNIPENVVAYSRVFGRADGVVLVLNKVEISHLSERVMRRGRPDPYAMVDWGWRDAVVRQGVSKNPVEMSHGRAAKKERGALLIDTHKTLMDSYGKWAALIVPFSKKLLTHCYSPSLLKKPMGAWKLPREQALRHYLTGMVKLAGRRKRRS